MRVHVVAPYKSHAMQQLVLPLLSHAPAWLAVSVGEVPDWTADLNYFIPWLGMLNTELKGPCVMYYTHTNKGSEQAVKWAADHCSQVVCMAETGQRELKDLGVTTPITTIHPPVHGFYPRKRNILIVGSEQPNGRKRSWLLLELAWKYDLTPYHFNIIGTGWEDVVEKLKNLGVSVTHRPTVDHDALQTAYHTSDALLVTGLREGGPLPVLEALASGIPVISPNYGFAAELGRVVLITSYDDVITLYSRLNELVKPVEDRVSAVRPYTVGRYQQDHWRLFQAIFKVPVMSRYDWLVDVVAETNPHYIMEIGTHVGNSAEAMIKEALKIPQWGTLNYYGFDLFRELSPEEMTRERSKQPTDIETVRTRLKALSKTPGDLLINLYSGDTRETLKGVYSGGPMDLIFVDGGHSWETIDADWSNIQKYIGPETVILFDDYYTGEVGETGCQKLIDGLSRDIWDVEILPPQETWGELRINMVRVKRR